jgi:hypothetical protein
VAGTMTGSQSEAPGPTAAAGRHPGGDVLAGYAAGSVGRVSAWSVEAHLACCAGCRSAVSAQVDPVRLARNRGVILVGAAVSEHGPVGRVLSRCGVPEHVLRLLTATPSLRLSWLLSVLGALAVMTGEAVLAAALSGGPVGSGYAGGQVLLPFVLAAPLLVLVAVAGAFLPAFDPAYRLAVAAPFSGFALLLVRTVSALSAALAAVVVAAFVVPGPGWLPAALLLPSLALCAFALAAAVVAGPRAAAVAAAAVWAVPVLGVAAAHSPLLVLHWHGQVGCAAVLLAAVALLAARRDRLEIGWTR